MKEQKKMQENEETEESGRKTTDIELAEQPFPFSLSIDRYTSRHRNQGICTFVRHLLKRRNEKQHQYHEYIFV